MVIAGEKDFLNTAFTDMIREQGTFSSQRLRLMREPDWILG